MYNIAGSVFLSILMAFACSTASACSVLLPFDKDSVTICKFEISAGDSVLKPMQTDTAAFQLESNEVKSSIVPSDELKKKKKLAAFFAFPFPFGFVGAHRVMLGTKPWIEYGYRIVRVIIQLKDRYLMSQISDSTSQY